MIPNIAVTIGDPAGVGPEVALKALADAEVAALARWTIVGDRAVLETTASSLGMELPSVRRGIAIEDLGLLGGEPVEPGKVNAACGRAAVGYVRRATEMCLAATTAAMVTAPLNKEAVVASGLKFTGHTEYIAELCGAKESRMLLAADRLRVIHVSTHVSLRRACELDIGRILRTIELGDEAVRAMGFAKPRIAVCGLNPHAGEHGLFGDEDAVSILPAIEAARKQGIHCDGPVPADTVFLKAVRGAYDLVVAMYHDQGHIAVKLLNMHNAVNITLGLPIVRTSVAHGTAFDLAWQGRAESDGMIEAVRMCAELAMTR